MEQEIKLTEIDSAIIYAIGHDAETNTLAIRFKNPKTETPTTLYHYDNFSSEQFDKFKNADSIGSYFYKNIKPNTEEFPYRKIIE